LSEIALREIQALQVAVNMLPTALDPTQGDNEFIQTAHFFAPGTYVRQLTRKAGVLIVGKQHKEACVTILLKGRIAVTSSTDDVPRGTIIEAGAVWVSKPGTKRATYALEDSILLTVHPNPDNLTDLDELEARIIEEELQ
jgi:quercetin dioxygenase-like cupin family protein